MKTSLSILFALSLFIVNPLYAQQAPAIEWQKCFGGSGLEFFPFINQTDDGGFIAAGETNSIDDDVSGNNGYYDEWIIRLDSSGNLLWQKCLGGSMEEQANCIQQTSDNGFIIVGFSNSFDGDVTGLHPGSDYYGYQSKDCWVVKIDSVGNIQWEKCLGGSRNDEGRQVQQTFEGGFILTGTTTSDDGDVSGWHYGFIDQIYPTTDFWVVKLDQLGNIEWQKCLGGSFWDDGYSIQQTTDSGYIVAGSTSSVDGDVSGNVGSFDYWIVKLNNAGNIQWQKCLGGTGYDQAEFILQSIEKSFVVAGWSNSNDVDVSGNNGAEDYWIVKLNSFANILWQKSFGGSIYETAKSIQKTLDDGYLIGGFTNSNDGQVVGNHGEYDGWLVKLDSIGNLEWQKCLGGTLSDYIVFAAQTHNGGFITSGWAESNNGDVSGNHGGSDFWVVKLSPEVPTLISTSPKKHFSIFPNPATTQLQLTLPSSQTSEIKIFNSLGEQVMSRNVAGSVINDAITLDVSSLMEGAYFIQFSNEREILTGKFVKQ